MFSSQVVEIFIAGNTSVSWESGNDNNQYVHVLLLLKVSERAISYKETHETHSFFQANSSFAEE